MLVFCHAILLILPGILPIHAILQCHSMIDTIFCLLSGGIVPAGSDLLV